MKFIDPRTDFAFKKIFGSHNSKKILKSFLNAVMGLEGEKRIVDLTILDPYQLPKIKELKYSILDVKCRDEMGTSFVVEMQVLKVEAIYKRIVYNVCKAYSNQLKTGQGYPRLNQVVGITITDFVIFDELDRYLTRHVIKEDLSNQVFLDEILFYFIELPKFSKGLSELESVLEKWIYFLKSAGKLDVIPENLGKEEEIREAFGLARIAGMSEEEVEMYEKYFISLWDQIGAVERGKREGIEIGKEEGIEIGKEEGMRLGLVEALRTALRLKFPEKSDEIMENVETVKDIKVLGEMLQKALEEDLCALLDLIRES